ncbi:MAG: mononuclear molybdenum enzyme YedY, partial [Acidobacteria bacterium]|nr:mononuclear molybdenum enzyme YedY [Acidobacteriota bacterium]
MPIRHSEVTPRSVYLNHRVFLAGAAAKFTTPGKSPLSTNETPTPYQDVTTYNNFYEFGTDKSQPAQRAHTLITSPWSVTIEGLVARPRVIDIDEILKLA